MPAAIIDVAAACNVPGWTAGRSAARRPAAAYEWEKPIAVFYE